MKAAVYYETGAPDVLRYEDVPDPVCGPGDGADRRRGDQHRGRRHAQPAAAARWPTTPHIVGYQCAGTIREVGEGVDRPRASASGSSRRCCGARTPSWSPCPRSSRGRSPTAPTSSQCACVPIAFGTADDCLFEFGHLQAGETVLVQAGAGGVGVAAIQLAKRAGATVLATASSDERLEPLRALGLDHGIDYSRVGLGRRGARAHRRPRRRPRRRLGRRHDPRRAASRASPTAGRCITVGERRAATRSRSTCRRSAPATSRSPACSSAPRSPPTARTQMIARSRRRRRRRPAARCVVDRTFPLAEAAAAHAYIESRQAVGRVV